VAEPGETGADGRERERDWWLRTLAVFGSPRTTFAGLRDDSEGAAEARVEPVLALAILAGIAAILLTRASGQLLDEQLVDGSGLVVAVLVFFLGCVYGGATYWLGGAALFVGLKGAGSRGSYRRARHLLAFAAAPLVLGLLVVWPLRLAVYGGDNFRTGGADEGSGGAIFEAAFAVFVGWSLVLLVYGISVVERWRLVRAAVSLVLVVLGLVIVTLGLVIPLSAS
jgi:hypothetical protein